LAGVRRLVLLAALLPSLLALPATGRAVTIGSDLSSNPTQLQGCFASPTCTYAQTRLDDRDVRAPFTGTLRRWTIAHSDGTFRLQVLERNPDGSFEVLHTSPAETFSSGTHSFRVRIPISRGDFIGIKEPHGSLLGVASTVPACFDAFIPGLHSGFSEMPNPDYSSCGADSELLYNATLRH
jgi:hypothetical protein